MQTWQGMEQSINSVKKTYILMHIKGYGLKEWIRNMKKIKEEDTENIIKG